MLARPPLTTPHHASPHLTTDAAIAKAIAAELRRHKADEAMVQEAEEIARRGEANARRDEQERKRQAALNEEKAKQKRARNTQVTAMRARTSRASTPPPTIPTANSHPGILASLRDSFSLRVHALSPLSHFGPGLTPPLTR